MSIVLHVGCGCAPLPDLFAGWTEVRLDIDPNVKPDIVGSITDIPVEADSYDAVYSSHNLEHLRRHEVPVALAEFRRVLNPGGTVIVTVPDLQSVAEHVAAGDLTGPLYNSASGPIAAIDVLFGHSGCIEAGNDFYAHRTGFVQGSLREAMERAGFKNVSCDRDVATFALWAKGVKE